MRYLKLPGLKAGEWCEWDDLMITACFQVLTDFMEKDSTQYIDWYHGGQWSSPWAEMVSLYMWWKFTRPYRRDPLMEYDGNTPPLDELCSGAARNNPIFAGWYDACDEQTELDRRHLAEDQHNLHRLIEVRGSMWV